MSIDVAETDRDTVLRDRALARLKKKRDFHAHLLVYTLVNSALVLIWVLTNDGTFFWPMFPMVFWGIGLVMNGWDVYRGQDFTEDQIREEMTRLQAHR